jgi:hypothetical protein
MKVNIMPCRFPLKMHDWPLLLQTGIEAKGDQVKISQRPDGSACHFFWGLHRAWGRNALSNKKTSIILERAYLGDRFNWYAFGFNGLNGMADFKNEDVKPDRWEKYWRGEVKPWIKSGEYALVVGQVPGDASLYGKDPYQWAAQAVAEAKKKYKRVVFRPHPSHRNPQKVAGAEYQQGSLEEALTGADCVITYSSNVAVDAVINGIPAISVHPGSMAREVTTRSLDEPFFKNDLDDWGRKIAYSQWTAEELKSGEAWAHLRRFI